MNRPRLPRRLAAAAGLLLIASVETAAAVEPAAIAVTARPIERFEIGSSREVFGSLRFRGGFSYRSDESRLTSISSIRMRGRDRFLAVADTGYWFAGTIRRDAAGRPLGIDDATLAAMTDPAGRPWRRKGEADAEALAIAGGEAIVAFEGRHRIESFRLADDEAIPSGRGRPLPLPIPSRELRRNGGVETIAVSPGRSPLKGAAVIVAERSVNAEGDLFAAILGSGARGLFAVRRDPRWSVTDGDFLPGGDLLLLERRYEGFGRVGMRIRRIEGASIRPGATVDGPVLIEADLGEEIDNMEGLDVWQDERGKTVLSLVSDDNASVFQRNLYLEFTIEAEGAASN